jgi:23S rRNA (uridine2552-2'-O)-methyltransferase
MMSELGGRRLKQRVKTAKNRSLASTIWLDRQLNDPYVHEAKRQGYRSRAAFKILQLDDKYHFFKPGKRVVDLGAAPGGWTQIAIDRVKGGRIVGLDILPIEPLAGADLIELDFLATEAPDRLKEMLGGQADIVLSDMSPPTTGHTSTDHLRIIGLVEVAYQFATEVLAPGGVFIAKVFQGGTENNLLADLKRRFKSVRHAKPPASRAGSAETYLVAIGFRGESD